MKGNVSYMKQYDFDIQDISENENSTVSYDFNAGGDNSPKNPKRHTLLKIVAGLMAMVVVSAGSIAVYKQVSPEKTVSGTVVSDSSETKEETSNSIKSSPMSLIEPDDEKGSVLTTEQVVEKVLPSVVGIESQFTITSQNNTDDFFNNFGGFGFGFGGFDFGNNEPSTSTATATGTGVVISEDGYVVTNAHVIYDTEYGGGLSDKISVVFNDDESHDAEVVGYDTDCDLAVLKIDADGLTPAEFGDSDELKLGESVVAIGNPLGFELMDTVTGGLVSGLNRDITINDKPMTLIQTDAAINSGNSGGPLINKYGQVIGINSSKMSSSYMSTEASIEGIGFAIPSNEVSRIVDDIMEYGYVTGKPQLGISCQDVTEMVSQMYGLPVGVYITDVTEGSAAEKAGLGKGDVITAVDGEKVTTSEELNAEKNKHEAGEDLEITYIENGTQEEKTITVTLDEAKSEN